MHNDLTADQKNADNLIRDWFYNSARQVFVLAGYAGTGKTTLLKHTVTDTVGLGKGGNRTHPSRNCRHYSA